MKIENVLQRFSCISFLFKPPWFLVSFSLVSFFVASMNIENFITA